MSSAPATPPPSTASGTAHSARSVAPAPTPTAVTAAKNPCGSEALPAPAPTPKVWAAGICHDHRKLEPLVAKAIKAGYQLIPGAAVDVQFGCDPLSFPRRLVFESSQGQKLRFHLVERTEADDYAVAIFEAPMGASPSDGQLRFGRGRLTEGDLVAGLRLARPALTATLREVNLTRHVLPSRERRDPLHVWASLEDGPYLLQAGYTGDNTGPGPRLSAAASYAVTQLTAMLQLIPVEATTARDEHRRLITAYVRAAWLRLGHPDAWFVRRPLVALLGSVGTRDAIPLLLDQLRRTLADSPATRDTSLRESLDALTKVSGWDPRENGQRDDLSAANLALQRCGELLVEPSPATE